MSTQFEVVTNIAEIKRWHIFLGKRLAKNFPRTEVREITWPRGHFEAEVHFATGKGDGVRAWAHSTETTKLHNFLLFGEPNASTWMEISVQMHFPAGEYNRRTAGAFIKDATGTVFVGHRGKLTKGMGALKQRDTFREFAPRVVEAQDRNQISEIILIASVEASDLDDRLWDFAKEAREVATRLGAQRDAAKVAEGESTGGASDKKRSLGGTQPKTPPTAPNRLSLLRKYFDEFAGTSEVKARASGKRTVEHGDIVKALEAQFFSKGDTQKAQAIDLAVVYRLTVDLFEVKTSARTTDVYTGVGQLIIHGESIYEMLHLPVKRYLVLPEQPKKDHARHITNKGGIHIITYRKTASGYSFGNLTFDTHVAK